MARVGVSLVNHGRPDLRSPAIPSELEVAATAKLEGWLEESPPWSFQRVGSAYAVLVGGRSIGLALKAARGAGGWSAEIRTQTLDRRGRVITTRRVFAGFTSRRQVALWLYRRDQQ